MEVRAKRVPPLSIVMQEIESNIFLQTKMQQELEEYIPMENFIARAEPEISSPTMKSSPKNSSKFIELVRKQLDIYTSKYIQEFLDIKPESKEQISIALDKCFQDLVSTRDDKISGFLLTCKQIKSKKIPDTWKYIHGYARFCELFWLYTIMIDQFDIDIAKIPKSAITLNDYSVLCGFDIRFSCISIT